MRNVCLELGVPIVFCETRPLAEECTYRFLAAAWQWAETESAAHERTTVPDLVLPGAPMQPEPSVAEVRAWARTASLDVPDRGRLRPEIWTAWRTAHQAAPSAVAADADELSPTGTSSRPQLRAGSALFAELDSDDVEAADPLEVSDVRGPDAPAGADGGGGDESAVGPDIDAGGGELSPEAGVGAGAQEVEREWWKGGEDGLDECLPPGPVLGGGAMDAVEQF